MKLSKFMKKKGWSYRELAKHLHKKGVEINHVTLYRYVKNKRSPRMEDAISISEALKGEVNPQEVCS